MNTPLRYTITFATAFLFAVLSTVFLLPLYAQNTAAYRKGMVVCAYPDAAQAGLAV